MRHDITIGSTGSDWLLDQGTPVWGAEIEHSLGPLVVEAIDALPTERHRSVVEMRLYAQWTFQRIADELGMPGRNYAHMYWKRSLKHIRNYIIEHGDVPADWEEEEA